MKELNTIQTRLNAPKNQTNKFGGYKYRSCEDILEALKPLLKETGCSLVINDDLALLGNRIFLKATAVIKNASGETESATAFAELDDNHKGMSQEQKTGSSSSYARKYALNGLFCIDDNKDADATNTHGKEAQASRPQAQTAPLVQLNTEKAMEDFNLQVAEAILAVEACMNEADLRKVWSKYRNLQGVGEFVTAKDRKKASLTA